MESSILPDVITIAAMYVREDRIDSFLDRTFYDHIRRTSATPDVEPCDPTALSDSRRMAQSFKAKAIAEFRSAGFPKNENQ
jgi:hypothetical protein